MLSSYRSKIDRSLAIANEWKSVLDRQQKKKLHLEKELSDHKIVREVYQQAAINTQAYLEKHISFIVTNALQAVFFEKDIKFIVKFEKKRNTSECELSIIEDGEEYDIIDDKGFGVADIASFALRVAYVLLDKSEKVLIMDEPFRNLDAERAPYASKMIKELSHKLGIQFIICTHIEDLSEHADKVIRIVKNGKYSEVAK